MENKNELLEDIKKLNLIKIDLIRIHKDFLQVFNKKQFSEKAASADWQNNFIQMQKAIEEMEAFLKQDINN